MRLSRIILSAAIAAMLASCSASKPALPYFQDIATATEGAFPGSDYTPVIMPDDELLITVYSKNPGATAIYNIPLANPATRDAMVSSTTPKHLTYLVNSKGDINFPVLGKIHVEGLTVEQLADKLTEEIGKNVDHPSVLVKLLNFNVNVAGEVNNPGRIQVNTHRFTILDALAASGDLTEYGNRSNVLIVREVDGKKRYARLNLNATDLFNSPYYYLRQNDYIYVEPNKVKESNAKYDTNSAYKLSVISTIVSAASVIASLVIALSVK